MIIYYFSFREGKNLKQAPVSYPFNCCGATYSKAKVSPRLSYTGKGIRVLDGHIGTEYEDNNRVVKHIFTRNGDLTVVVRKVGT